MRVAGDRVRSLDTSEMMLELRRDDRSAAPGGVDMKPQVCFAQTRAISGSGSITPAAVVPAVPTTMNGRNPLRAVFSDRAVQLLNIHLEIAVRRDQTKALPSEPGHVRDFVEAMMRLPGEVDRRLRGEAAEVRVRRSREMRASSATTTAERFASIPPLVKVAIESLRQTELCGEPTKCVALHLVGRGRGAPVRQLWVIHGDQGVGDHRCQGHAGVEEAEVARVRHLHLPFMQHLLHVGDYVVQAHAPLEVVARLKVSANLFRRYIRDDGTVRDTRLRFGELIPKLIDVQRMPPLAYANDDLANRRSSLLFIVGPRRTGFGDTDSHRAEHTRSIPAD